MKWIVAILVASLLAGCSEEAPPAAPADDFELEEDLQATDTTGIIRGVVVDQAVVPIAGVTVSIVGTELAKKTNDEGLFGFAGLEQGTYFLELKKLGYKSVQGSAEVVAGESAPPVVKIQMIQDFSAMPYATPHYHKGYYQCGLAFVVVCGAPNVLLGDGTAPDSSTATFYFDANMSFVQTEMLWDTTQTVSPKLYFEMEALDDGCTGDAEIHHAEGESPIKAWGNKTNLDEHNVNPDDCGIYYSVFAGDVLEHQQCEYWVVPLVKCAVGFSIEQNFEWFTTEFHGFAPPEDWWYTEDGMIYPEG